MYYICFKKIEKKGDISRKNIYTALYSYKSPLYEKSDKPPGRYSLDRRTTKFGSLPKFLIL